MKKPIPTPLCAHIMPTGNTCGVPASRGSRFCFHHDPERAGRKPLRAAASSLEPLDSISGLYRLLDQTMRNLLQGKIDARRARALVATVQDGIASQALLLRSLDVLCRSHQDRINRTHD